MMTSTTRRRLIRTWNVAPEIAFVTLCLGGGVGCLLLAWNIGWSLP
jgi:hypothetical protein